MSTQLSITIEILEYLPSNINFDNFIFIFSSESKDFEEEITYQNKNQILHKMYYTPKKNIRFPIKVIMNNSLVGISDLIIPQNILQQKKTIYNTQCIITMTDSIRRLIFGNNFFSNNIKINMQVTLKYPDKKSTSIKKDDKFRNITPKNYKVERKKFMMCNSGNSYSNLKMSKQKSANKKNFSNTKKMRSFSRTGTVSKNSIKNKEKLIDICNEKDINNISYKKIKENKEKTINIEPLDNSIIDENLKNDQFLQISKDIYEFVPNFIKTHPIENLVNIENLDDKIDYIKNVINDLLEYQINYYEILKNSIELNKKFTILLLQYNEKYRLMLKKINATNEEINKNEIKNDLTIGMQNNETTNLIQLLPMKETELELFKEMYSIELNPKEIEEYSEIQNQINLEKKNNDERTRLLLLKVLKHLSINYGPLNTLVNEGNSTEEERININNISIKYNLPMGKLDEKNFSIHKLEYIINENPTDLDIYLDNYLKKYYSQKNKICKIKFKNIEGNKYEYGNMKVEIKKEGNNIKIKYNGQNLVIDKFFELNSNVDGPKKKGKKGNNKKK